MGPAPGEAIADPALGGDGDGGGVATATAKRRRPGNTPAPRAQPPMSFFMRRSQTPDLKRSVSDSAEVDEASRTLGIRSLDSTFNESTSSDSSTYRRDGSGYSENLTQESTFASSPADSVALKQVSPPKSPDRFVFKSASGTNLDINLASQICRSNSPSTASAFSSAPKSLSVKSFGLYDDDAGVDDTESQAIASSEEDEDEKSPHRKSKYFENAENHDMPQLVMPSIHLPSRRPFTERGMNLGKLKVVVAGRAGSGKTSLIKSLIKQCDDIVSVDVSNLSSKPDSNTIRDHEEQTRRAPLMKFVEVYGSTKPYPGWWQELAQSRNTQVQYGSASTTGSVLNRNLCFLDTPGYNTPEAFARVSQGIREHIETLFRRTFDWNSLTDSQIVDLLSGEGGFQVDLLIYVFDAATIMSGLSAEEIAFLKIVSNFTSLLPVIAKSDTSAADQIIERKQALLSQLHENDITFFNMFEGSNEEHTTDLTSQLFAISSATSLDEDDMDASLLMDSGYVQPLEDSELPQLINALFNSNTFDRLRYSAASKCLCWRNMNYDHLLPTLSDQPRLPFPSAYDLRPSVATNEAPLAPAFSIQTPTMTRLSSASLGDQKSLMPRSSILERISDHTQREERLAQVHLAKWAANLQQALSNERTRFAQLQDSERAEWLTEKLNECVTADPEQASIAPRKLKASALNPNDPLKLLDLHQQLKNNGVVMLKVIGGASIVGALAVWLMRVWDGKEQPLGDVKAVSGLHIWSQLLE